MLKTRDIALRQLAVVGGQYGVWLSNASAQITGNEVAGVMGPYGMGIELANTVSRS